MSDISARWLLILYRPPSAVVTPIGIALHVPSRDTLHLYFRDGMDFVDSDDIEVLAGMSAMVRQLAMEKGAAWTFQWMSDSLSNVVFVEGPKEVFTDNPEQTLRALWGVASRS